MACGLSSHCENSSANCWLAFAAPVQAWMRPGKSLAYVMKSLRSGNLPLGKVWTHSGLGAKTMVLSKNAVDLCRHFRDLSYQPGTTAC